LLIGKPFSTHGLNGIPKDEKFLVTMSGILIEKRGHLALKTGTTSESCLKNCKERVLRMLASFLMLY
jgi:hypothetical protein